MTKHEPIQRAVSHEPYRFSQRDYILLADHGAFDKLAKTELIEGVIIAVNAQYSRHARVQTQLLRLLADACDAIGGELGAWVEASVSIDEASMPRPDIFVSRGLPKEGPVPVDRIALIVEVADTSLTLDLEVKPGLYASAGVPEYWVADVNARVIHQMWSPSHGSYGGRHERAFGETIAAQATPELSIDTERL